MESEVDQLISGVGKKTAVYLQLLKETGARAGEAWNLRWVDINSQQGTVNHACGMYAPRDLDHDWWRSRSFVRLLRLELLSVRICQSTDLPGENEQSGYYHDSKDCPQYQTGEQQTNRNWHLTHLASDEADRDKRYCG